MIEECKSFLSHLGFYEISNIYIVLRELLFNTILFQTQSGKNCTFDCKLVYKGNGKFEITLTGIDNEADSKLFDWVSQYSPGSPVGRSNTLIYGISEEIVVNETKDSIVVYVMLENTHDFIEILNGD
jgi:hypothetical protein